MTDRELMQQALEALENAEDQLPKPYSTEAGYAITALRDRLAQPETVMAEYKLQTYAAYKTDGEMKIGVVPGVYEVTGPLHVVCQCDKCKAQPEQEQEPVAWGVFEGNLHDMFFTASEAVEMAQLKGTHAEVKPLYTTPQPRQWVGLTDEDRVELWADSANIAGFGGMKFEHIRAVEAKLKEKNT